jgi:hypothetical protein
VFQPERIALNDEVTFAGQSTGFGAGRAFIPRRIFVASIILFVTSFLVLFACMPLRGFAYDEGLMLTAGMRVAAGQIPHQDFYANYGPAEFYVFAGLFKLFGQSILIERVWDIFVKSLLVACAFCVLSFYCHRTVALCGAAAIVFWLIGLQMYAAAVTPVSLLDLVASILVLPMMSRAPALKYIFPAGVVAGLATLFRYDTGLALFALQVCVISVTPWLRKEHKSTRMREGFLALSSYFLGFCLTVVPAALYYLSVASIRPLIYDMIVYPRSHYVSGRSLPFPAIHLRPPNNLTIYLPLVVMALCLYAVLFYSLNRNTGESLQPALLQDRRIVRRFLILFGLLSLLMYFKGIVRIHPQQMYLSLIPALLLLAVLFEYRKSFSRAAGIAIVGVAGLCILAAGYSAAQTFRIFLFQHVSVPQYLLTSIRRTRISGQAAWCARSNALTWGMCFLPETIDSVRAIEFIEDHTAREERLYVGLPRHDRIYINDNLIYFATGRLPATKWSHFDPGLQNSYPIQEEMIQELDRITPQYIVEDKIYDSVLEPNESAKSSGVFVLDDYIHSHYRLIEAWGTIFILKRK